MAEGSYEYECMRAELLGVDKPDYEQFLKNKEERNEANVEEQDIDNLNEVDQEDEKLRHLSGGLQELNSILQVTQRKINRFKASCGSLTSLLKFKLGSGSSNENLGVKDGQEIEHIGDITPESTETQQNDSGSSNQRKSDLARALDNHVDKLDSLIDQAENAQYSMSHQTKEMKRFLN